MSVKLSTRQVGGITVIDASGRITLGEGASAFRDLIRDLAAKREGEQKALSEAQVEIERLRLIVKKLQRLQFGRRAERLDEGQLELGLEDLGADIGRVEELLPTVPA